MVSRGERQAFTAQGRAVTSRKNRSSTDEVVPTAWEGQQSSLEEMAGAGPSDPGREMGPGRRKGQVEDRRRWAQVEAGGRCALCSERR